LLNFLEALQAILVILMHEHRPHPLSSVQHGLQAASRSVLVQREVLGLSDGELYGLAAAWSDAQGLHRDVTTRALLAVTSRGVSCRRFSP